MSGPLSPARGILIGLALSALLWWLILLAIAGAVT